MEDKKCGLIKFGALKHMKAFYEKGEMYFNTFKYFKELADNDDGRADKHEYASMHYACENMQNYKLRLKEETTGTFIDFTKENGFIDATLDFGNDKEYTHLYSMSYININWCAENDLIIDTRNFAEGKDYAVIIYDLPEFKKLFLKQMSLLNCGCRGEPIEYVNKLFYTGEMGAFRKFDKYSYQNEYRIAVNFNTLKPKKIHLGSLKNIASKPLNYKEFYKVKTEIGNIKNGEKNVKLTISNKSAFK